MKQEEEEVDIDLKDPEVLKAAMLIQKKWGSKKHNKDVEVDGPKEEEVDIDLKDPEV